jgi:hypothetical protein
MTLTNIKDELKEMQSNAMYDLQADWNEEKALMTIQLQLLTTAIANIELILAKPHSQIFKSSISI